jgi:hypothetical protein
MLLYLYEQKVLGMANWLRGPIRSMKRWWISRGDWWFSATTKQDVQFKRGLFALIGDADFREAITQGVTRQSERACSLTLVAVRAL